MGTTTKGLPYPEGTDLLRDGDNAIRSLAEAIDTKLPADTAWTTMTLVGGWLHFDSGLTNGGTGRIAQYRRLSGVVYLRGIIRTGTVGTDFFNMPVGFRWTARAGDDWYQPCVSNSALGVIVGRYTPTGNIGVSGGSNSWVDLGSIRWTADA